MIIYIIYAYYIYSLNKNINIKTIILFYSLSFSIIIFLISFGIKFIKSELPFNKKDARTFVRSFFSGATVCEFDKSGRINITSPLVSYADLTKECVVIGANDRLEIWGKANWDNFFEENSEKLEDIAENLFNELDI